MQRSYACDICVESIPHLCGIEAPENGLGGSSGDRGKVRRQELRSVCAKVPKDSPGSCKRSHTAYELFTCGLHRKAAAPPTLNPGMFVLQSFKIII